MFPKPTARLLVTNFMALNRIVRHPTHPFPSTREIIEAIPSDTKLFCKLDAVHRYYQLALRKVQQTDDTQVQIPTGDHGPKHLLRQLDIIIQGLPYTRKIMDDTIIWAKDEQELEERINVILTRWTMSPSLQKS